MVLKVLRFLIYYFLIILLINSCNHPFDIEYDETFTIKFSEKYNDINLPSNPVIFLSVRTDSIYGTIYALKSDIVIKANTILLKIMGFDSSRAVNLGIEGPRADSYMLDLQNGQYQLKIEYQDYSDEYYVNINSKSIEIESQYSSFTNPEYHTYWRYPPKSFMYHSKTSNETEWISEQFLDTLSNMIKLKEFQFPSYGKICYSNSWNSSDIYNLNYRYFYYENETDFEKAGHLLLNYLNDSLNVGGRNRIYLLNWQKNIFDKYF